MQSTEQSLSVDTGNSQDEDENIQSIHQEQDAQDENMVLKEKPDEDHGSRNGLMMVRIRG